MLLKPETEVTSFQKNMPRTKVLYIVGSNRCGSTLLARVLGDLPGFAAIGEGLVHFFYGSSDDHVPCGCGMGVHECPFWKEIPLPLKADRLAARWLRLRRTVLLNLYLRRHPEQARQWVSSISNFYHGIAERAGAQVIVDSSKSPFHARLLSMVPDIDLYVVHLIRDPRDVAASSHRPKDWLPGASPLHAATRWLAMTLGSAYLQTCVPKSRTLRYEDFVKEPGRTILEITEDLGFKALATPFINGSVVDLGPHHMLGSNPDKLRCGPTTVVAKSTDLPWFGKVVVSAITAPALWRYGYFPRRTPEKYDTRQAIRPLPEMAVPDTREDI